MARDDHNFGKRESHLFSAAGLDSQISVELAREIGVSAHAFLCGIQEPADVDASRFTRARASSSAKADDPVRRGVSVRS
jgi:hypothetical protein